MVGDCQRPACCAETAHRIYIVIPKVGPRPRTFSRRLPRFLRHPGGEPIGARLSADRPPPPPGLDTARHLRFRAGDIWARPRSSILTRSGPPGGPLSPQSSGGSFRPFVAVTSRIRTSLCVVIAPRCSSSTRFPYRPGSLRANSHLPASISPSTAAANMRASIRAMASAMASSHRSANSVSCSRWRYAVRVPIPAAPAAARTFAVLPSTRRNFVHLASDVGLPAALVLRLGLWPPFGLPPGHGLQLCHGLKFLLRSPHCPTPR